MGEEGKTPCAGGLSYASLLCPLCCFSPRRSEWMPTTQKHILPRLPPSLPPSQSHTPLLTLPPHTHTHTGRVAPVVYQGLLLGPSLSLPPVIPLFQIGDGRTRGEDAHTPQNEAPTTHTDAGHRHSGSHAASKLRGPDSSTGTLVGGNVLPSGADGVILLNSRAYHVLWFMLVCVCVPWLVCHT